MPACRSSGPGASTTSTRSSCSPRRTPTRRLVEAGVALLGQALEALLDGAPGRLPDLTRSSYRSSVGHRPLESAASAVEAERMVRAGVPNMLAWTTIDGRPAYVRAA